jgi:hypothetical protein
MCECCERISKLRSRQPGQPNIVAIQVILHYKGTGKSIQKASRSIRVCTDCLALAMVEPKLWERKESRRLLAALRERISSNYSYVLEVDALNQVHRPAFKGSGNLLEGL